LRKSILSARQEPNTNCIDEEEKEEEEEEEENSYDQREEVSFFARLLERQDERYVRTDTSSIGSAAFDSIYVWSQRVPDSKFHGKSTTDGLVSRVRRRFSERLACLAPDAAIIGVRGLYGGTSLIEELV